MNNIDIDELVAQDILGWSWSTEDGAVMSPDRNWYAGIDFKPSTDISDAWKVVEKMSLFSGEYYLYDNSVWTFPDDIYVNASTVEMAICLAALKAKGIEVEED